MRMMIVSCPGGGHKTLTARGREQALDLAERMPLDEGDVIVAGPFPGMLQMAGLWAGEGGASRFIHPLAETRAHPFRLNRSAKSQGLPVEPTELVRRFPEWLPANGLPEHLWLQGVHALPPLLFGQHAGRFAVWCRTLGKSRIAVVTDEGMRMALLEALTEEEDFKNCLFL
ncbi:histidine phosphatase family protein [Paenibacillus filicis]|uniref:Histidine phosphatase family protein n=1 Tax=Paenibacillus filicis TaxID=669464 RepID=A0ABU9DV66_9BACL